MDEVYTCKCGNQSWTILDGFIRCYDCDQIYDVGVKPEPWEFHNKRHELEG